MGYATSMKVKNAWNSVTDAQVDATRIQDAIDYADGIIDGKLKGVYAVPFSEPYDKLIVGIATDLAVFKLKVWKDPRMVVDADGKLDINYKLALNLLQELADGKSGLGSVSQRQLVESNTEDDQPIADLDDETNWDLDEDRADRIEDARD